MTIRNRELLEFQNSVLSITVGVVFMADTLFDGNLYSRYPDTYQFMRVLPSWIWGIIYISAGSVHVATLFFDIPWVRKQVLLVKGALWVYLGWCVIYADLYAMAGWLYLIFAIFAMVFFFRFNRRPGV